MPELYKTFDIPDEVDDEASGAVEYGHAPRFDLETGDFVLAGGRPQMLDGHASWVQWVVMTALTPRFAYPVYSDDYGTEMDDLRGAGSRQEAEDLAETTIREALLVDPRTGEVDAFEFQWEGDSLFVVCTVEPTIGPPARVPIDPTLFG